MPRLALLAPAAMLSPPKVNVPAPTLFKDNKPPTNGLVIVPVKVVFVPSRPVVSVAAKVGWKFVRVPVPAREPMKAEPWPEPTVVEAMPRKSSAVLTWASLRTTAEPWPRNAPEAEMANVPWFTLIGPEKVSERPPTPSTPVPVLVSEVVFWRVALRARATCKGVESGATTLTVRPLPCWSMKPLIVGTPAMASKLLALICPRTVNEPTPVPTWAPMLPCEPPGCCRVRLLTVCV